MDAGKRLSSVVLAALFAWALISQATLAGDAQGAGTKTNGEITEDNDDDGFPNTPDPEGDSDNKHPSGKDRHAESGKSGNQGSTSSTPDQNGRGPERDHGGTDKPGGPGGVDTLDQDGNNGCGNDDDFEDDNEGRCGGVAVGPSVVSDESRPPPIAPRSDTEVLGERFEVEEKGAVTEVLGEQLSRTGGDLRAPAIAGVALLALGTTCVALARRRRAAERY